MPCSHIMHCDNISHLLCTRLGACTSLCFFHHGITGISHTHQCSSNVMRGTHHVGNSKHQCFRLLQPGHNYPSRLQHQRPCRRLGRPQLHNTIINASYIGAKQAEWAQNPNKSLSIDANSDIWSALDVVGWVGSVAGTAAFILTQELWLIALPVLLPLLALYASRKKQAV